MKITLEMILTKFFQEHPQETTAYTPAKQVINGIQLLPHHVRELSEEFLYVTDLPFCDIREQIPLSVPVLSFSRYSEDTSDFPNFISIRTEMELADAFNQLQKCFQVFIDWERQLDFAVFRNAGFQELIDLSKEIITFPVLVYDPALKLLAHSTDQAALNDRIFQGVIANGYLDAETVKYFDKTHIFEQMDASGKASGMTDQFREHDDFAVAINIHNELAVYCVMLYTGSDSRSYTEQLFQVFCDSIRSLLEKQHTDFLRNRSVTDYFLMDLLDNPKTPEKQIRERIVYNDLDYEGNYIAVTIHSDIRRTPSENYFVQILRNNLINSRIFPYRQRIVILYQLPRFRETSYRDYLIGQLTPILKDFSGRKLKLYFSRPFSTIGQFAAAYTQAENICRILHGDSEKMFCFYEDYQTDDLFFMNTSADLLFSYCEPSLLAMLEDGTKKSRRQLKILYEYLNCDRKLTIVAEKLGMHRNNVLYHIKQVEDTWKLCLEDPKVRLKLLISFELLRYCKILDE